MSGGEAIVKVRNLGAQNVGDEYPIPADPATGAVQVTFVGGGGQPLPFASWKSSGTLTGAAIAVSGYAADVPTTINPTAIQYPRGSATTNVQLSVFVTSQNFTVASTTFTVYRNGVATLLSLTYLFNETGLKTATLQVAFSAGDQYDLRLDNPGNAGDVNKVIKFGASADFF